jgi:hypothetical protein
VFLNGTACLLRKSASGESSTVLTFLMREEGLQSVILKGSGKKGMEIPDLFQVGELSLRKKTTESIGYVEEFSLIEAFPGVARSYERLISASILARFFESNCLHLEEYLPAWKILLQSLRALDQRPHPQAVVFKAVFCFLRDEGYPVTQSWLQQLSTSSRAVVSKILHEPLDALELTPATTLHWLERLSAFIERDTAVYPPEWERLRPHSTISSLNSGKS